MSQEDREVYLLQGEEAGEGDGWVNPKPAREAIASVLSAATDVDAEEVDELAAYVDPGEVRDVLSAETERTVSFEVEGHEVTVDSAGTVSVTD